jgi:hypothetical protein
MPNGARVSRVALRRPADGPRPVVFGLQLQLQLQFLDRTVSPKYIGKDMYIRVQLPILRLLTALRQRGDQLARA